MMFVNGILDRPNARIVALLEPNRVRADFYNAHLEKRGQARVPVYTSAPGQFEEMVEKEKVETVVVTCVDALHEGYIVSALKKSGECACCH